MSFPVPENESERLASLLDLGLQDTTGSPEFDAIANLAADVLDCPMALISLLGENEQWFKAKYGLDADVSPRELAFCNHTILSRGPLIVGDAREDDRFKNNPLVLGEPHVVFYAGAPISIDGVHNLGTLCAIDTKPRQMTDLEVGRLRNLARAAEGLIAAYKNRRQAECSQMKEQQKGQELARAATLMKQVTQLSGVGGWELELKPMRLTWTDQTKAIHEVPVEYEPKLEHAIEFYAPEARPIITKAIEEAIETGIRWDVELPMVSARGRKFWARAVGTPTYKDGAMVSLVGAFQDISESKHTEARIRDSEAAAHSRSEELRTILNTMDEGVSVFDADSKLSIWNRKYIEIFDKPDGEVELGVPFRRLLESEKARGDFPGDINAHLRELSDQLDQQTSVTCQFRTKAGKIIDSTHAPLPGGGWVGTHSDVTAQVRETERADYASRHDPLTGLPNRLAFNARMEAIEADSNGRNQALVLMLVDLDRFKKANDTYGHLVGDGLLKSAAERLQSCVRKSDLVVRLGGDEFAIILECDDEDAFDLAETIAKAVCKEVERPFEINGRCPSVGASIGLCVSPAGNFELDTIITKADGALYKAKENGRGGYQFYDEAITTLAHSRRQQQEAVDTAIRDHNLGLAFQPIYDLQSLKPSGAEALIRWKSESADGLDASDLIRIAEETGKIDEIGLWVLEESLLEAANWNADLSVAVNVSPHQLGTGRLCSRLQGLLKKTRFPAARLELEITENALLAENSNAFEELADIQMLGTKIVLDDFGTGYASLSYLQRFPFDKLKIDRSFVLGSQHESPSRAIVSAIVQLAKNLGMETTAEGIQNADNLHNAQDLGCTLGQGYHLSRPLSPHAIRTCGLHFGEVA